MAEIIDLHSTRLDINSDAGRAFIVDATRAAEGVISDSDLQAKYEISAADLRSIAKNPAVGKAIRLNVNPA